MKKFLMMLSLTLFSCAAFAQHEHADHEKSSKKMMVQQESMVMFKDAQLTTAYGHYLNLKDALVASDQAAGQKASEALQQSLKGFKTGTKAAAAATLLAKAPSLAEQRTAFSGLSNEMTKLVKDNDLTMGELYLEYCPMANDNKGGSWLSNEKEIKNPYFGDRMLKCGSVKETIK